MTYANLDRVKRMLELTVPALNDREDYDEELLRLMGVVHEKIRLRIVKMNGGTLAPFLILEDLAIPVNPITLDATLTNAPRRIRVRLRDADESELDTTPMVITLTGDIDGITEQQEVSFPRNGEFVTRKAFETLELVVPVSDIPGTPGTIQFLEGVDPVLEDIEDMFTACMFLRESIDRFVKEAETEEADVWCKKGGQLLKDWISVNIAANILDHPLALRAES